VRNTILSTAGALILDEAGRVLLVEPKFARGVHAASRFSSTYSFSISE